MASLPPSREPASDPVARPLPPLAVIFALLAFGQLFGFAGALLALPVSAAMLVALRRVRAAYVDSPLYRG